MSQILPCKFEIYGFINQSIGHYYYFYQIYILNKLMKNNMTEIPQILLNCQGSNLLPFFLSLQCRCNQYPGHRHHQSSLLCSFTLSVLQSSCTAGRFFPQMLATMAAYCQPRSPATKREEQSPWFLRTFYFLD